ncbi:hypothetical protein SAMN05444274_103252 [Mariniphaga anaerophila]|uniref:Uncharacterized protein n=2 Tax=Mariniphaga anaerophila TaxID=1484053 RepID=A0A1M4Y6U8_9BACT|nr:hypothetical protein SAMN05444274_103252 [Mariniphaga anaerophila]
MFSAFVVCFLVASFSVNASGYTTELLEYEITAVDNLNLGKSVAKVWNLTYSEGGKSVTVIKRNTSEGAVYVVNSDFFEVCYASTTKGFGTRTMKKSWSKVPFQINDVVINSDEVKKQQIITPEKVDDKKALGLIASYLPVLLNEQYTHLLN